MSPLHSKSSTICVISRIIIYFIIIIIIIIIIIQLFIFCYQSIYFFLLVYQVTVINIVLFSLDEHPAISQLNMKLQMTRGERDSVLSLFTEARNLYKDNASNSYLNKG